MFTTTAANETNPMLDSDAYFAESPEYMTLAQLAAAGGRITRVRLLTERWPSGRMADISYIHGMVGTTRVSITDLPATNELRNVKGDFIAWAKEAGVFAKGLGLLDEGNWSILF